MFETGNFSYKMSVTDAFLIFLISFFFQISEHLFKAASHGISSFWSTLSPSTHEDLSMLK